MNVLITNDDGIKAQGIIELAKAVSKIAKVYVIAPDSQRSAMSHAITMHNPIMLNNEYINDDIVAYSTSGTPADCVKIGVDAVLKDIKIDLLLSGINNGPNLGTDVIYSGTVSAAMEGFIQNIPSIAISYDAFDVDKETYKRSSEYIVEIINIIKEKENIFDNSILNINIPSSSIKGYKITTLGDRKYENDMQERVTPNGKTYFWIGGSVKELPQTKDSDVLAVKEGYVSITPLNIGRLNNEAIDILKDKLKDILK